MKAITKLSTLFILSFVTMATVFLVGCDQGAETKKVEVKETVVEPTPAPAPAPDSLPKMDTSASTRPDPIKTK